MARHPETRALVLLSAHAGGNRLTDPNAASRYTINEKTGDLIKEAQVLLAAGKPRQLMLIPTWWHVISARTFMDRLTNVPSLVENAKRIRCPVLFTIRRKNSKRTAQRRTKSPLFRTAIISTWARKNGWEGGSANGYHRLSPSPLPRRARPRGWLTYRLNSHAFHCGNFGHSCSSLP